MMDYNAQKNDDIKRTQQSYMRPPNWRPLYKEKNYKERTLEEKRKVHQILNQRQFSSNRLTINKKLQKQGGRPQSSDPNALNQCSGYYPRKLSTDANVGNYKSIMDQISKTIGDKDELDCIAVN